MQGKWESSGQWAIAPAPPLSPHQKLESYFNVAFSSWQRWYLFEGVGLVLIGVVCVWGSAAIARPFFTETLLIAAGAIMLISALRAIRLPGFGLSLAVALMALASGAYLLGVQRGALTEPGLAFAAYFAASGAARLLLAIAHRRRHFHQWEWLAVGGATSLILALLVLSGLPGPFTWMLGVLLGVDFIFGGSARLALALASDEL